MSFAASIIVPVMTSQGPMHLSSIYRRIEARNLHARLSPYWRATVRDTLQRHCRTNPKFNGRSLFRHVGKGRWECLI